MNLKFYGTTLKTSASKLFEILGEPSVYTVNPRQTTISWVREFDTADVFTIFYVKYSKDFNTDEEVFWHIGGQNKLTTESAKVELLKLIK